jgi:hypothetical protein
MMNSMGVSFRYYAPSQYLIATISPQNEGKDAKLKKNLSKFGFLRMDKAHGPNALAQTKSS